MKSPAAYKRLTDEIDRASQAGELSLPAIRYQEAIRLPYLDACCKEGMRLHPSVGFHLPRLVPPGGCSILSQWFPEGSRVGVNAAVVHRDKSIFGDDADYFRPERWLQEDSKHMERYMFQVRFGLLNSLTKQPTDKSRLVWRWFKDLHWQKRESTFRKRDPRFLQKLFFDD